MKRLIGQAKANDFRTYAAHAALAVVLFPLALNAAAVVAHVVVVLGHVEAEAPHAAAAGRAEHAAVRVHEGRQEREKSHCQPDS